MLLSPIQGRSRPVDVPYVRRRGLQELGYLAALGIYKHVLDLVLVGAQKVLRGAARSRQDVEVVREQTQRRLQERQWLHRQTSDPTKARSSACLLSAT